MSALDQQVADRSQDMLEAALGYAQRGFAVFPLHEPGADGICSCGAACKSPGKHPRTSQGFKAATTDESQIRAWWTQWPEANIGIATGGRSGLVVIDIDGVAGEELLQQLAAIHGPLSATMKVRTGNGYHLYFKHPGISVKSKAPICRGRRGLDSRADGGYVVAAPSLHHSGARYEIDPAMPQQLATPPVWLIEVIAGGSPSAPAGAAPAANSQIAEGSRNCTLASLAGSMRAKGFNQAAIEAALLAHNAEQCQPPLEEDEVRAIARSISNYVLRSLTDVGNAERFAKQWGDRVRYVPELRQWLVWDDARQWRADAARVVIEMAKQTASDIYREGDTVGDTNIRDHIVRHSKLSQQAPRLEAILKLAQSIPALVAPIATLDADPWLLAVENGTLDLRTGTLRPPSLEDYITRVAPVTFDPEAQCPEFLRFLQEIMDGDQELVDYLQRLMGYMLTGDTREQRLFFLYGSGANGKSTLLNVCKAILGSDLCRQTPSETIMARPNRSGATPELACLHGTRAVMTTEVDEGSLLSESLVKQMTGGDPLPARHLYGKPFEFVPWFKLFVAGNHKPRIHGSDEGIWRRIDLIPFAVTIPTERRDSLLAEKLRAELPGILRWALTGCRAWLHRRLDSPPAVVDAVAEYREDMDFLGQWILQACEIGPELEVQANAAYLSYRAWAEESGNRPWGSRAFANKMQERFKRRRTASGNMYLGIGLRSPPGVAIPKAKVPPTAV